MVMMDKSTSNTAKVLSFAVVGHPNEGKSSLVSTLTERDDIRISPTPGETEHSTEYTVEVDHQALLRFIDTPGFQVPKKTLKWLKKRAEHEDAGTISEAFDRDFSRRPAFVHDSRILRAVADTQGLLYVLDASKPLGPDDLAEMEILRRLGKTRMAILNSKGDESEYVEEWRAALNRHFNAVRLFNAREAAFDERIRLLGALRLTDQHWEKTLDTVITTLNADRRGRMSRAADIICDLVVDCMTKTIRTQLKAGDDAENLQESMMPEYTGWLRQREIKSQHELRKVFRHRQFEMKLEEAGLVAHDLFARETWRVLGLTKRQLTTVSAVAGAAAGAAVDLALGELSFGIFMTGGAVFGGISGLAGSRPLSRVKVRFAGMKHQLGTQYIELGPPKGIQLAFILIDRALLYLDTVSRWAHAKRVEAEADNIISSLLMTRQWSRRDQAVISRLTGRLIKGKGVEQELENLRNVLVSVIEAAAPAGDK